METIMNKESNFRFGEARTELNEKMVNFLNQWQYECGHYYEATRYGVNEVLDEVERNKGWLYELFSKHPSYNGKGQIILTEEYSRKMDANLVYEFCQWIIDRMCDHNRNVKSHKFHLGDKVTLQKTDAAIWVPPMDEFDGKEVEIVEDHADEGYYMVEGIEQFCFTDECFKENYEPDAVVFTKDQVNFFRNFQVIQYANEQFCELINTAFPWLKAHANAKVSKLVNRICKKYKFNEIDGFNRKYTVFADAINPLKVTRYTVLSVHPIDFWTMSFGKDWASCHTIDKTNMRRTSGQHYSGCYSAGTQSYMQDPSTFVVYIVDKAYNGDEFELQPKLSRQMFHIGEDKLVQGRLYPQDNDTGADETYKEIRAVVQRVIGECYGVNNLWTNRKGTSACSDVIISEGVHYRDYEYFDNCNVSYLKREGVERNMTRIRVGADPICPSCGRTHDREECVQCEECCDVDRCDSCGDPIGEEGVRTADGFGYCSEYCAREAGYVYCNNVEEWHHEDEGNVFYDSYLCEYFYDDCGSFIETEDGNYYMDAFNAEHDGYTETYYGDWFRNDEVYECEHCGRIVHESEWNEEREMCDRCAEESEVE